MTADAEPGFQRDVRSSRESTLEALAEAAELWSAAWEAHPGGGRLHLPLLASVRCGRLLSDVEVTETGSGSSIRLHVESLDYRVNRAALFFLVMGALGALVVLLWPLAPALGGLVPFGVVMMIGAWLLVASRVRSAGPEDFLDTVAEIAEGDSSIDESCVDEAPFRP